jgi:hypothetical protein
MALTERRVIDQITVLEDGQLQVREATVIERDGVEISRLYHRHVVVPGDNLDNENSRVRAVGEVEHTAAVIAAYRAASA